MAAVLRHIVESRILAVDDIQSVEMVVQVQPVMLVVDTVEVDKLALDRDPRSSLMTPV